MHLDFGDHHPDTPRVPSVISVREGVLLSLVIHMAFVIAILLKPDVLFRPAEPMPQVVPPAARDAIRYVDMRPLKDQQAPPPRLAEQSDQDRRSATRERPPDPRNANPFSRGNTPEKIEGGPPAQPSAPAPPSAPSPETAVTPPAADASRMASLTPPAAVAPPRPPGPNSPTLGQSLRNLEQYLRTERFDNPQGGNTDTYSDIQFDSKGVDFGPWLRRFKAQVERNWIVPDAAMGYRGRTVIQFYVLRNGFIVGLNVVQPAGIAALTTSALSALKLSNPTAVLPPEYPDDRVFFTVTFHYNEYDRNTP